MKDNAVYCPTCGEIMSEACTFRGGNKEDWDDWLVGDKFCICMGVYERMQCESHITYGFDACDKPPKPGCGYYFDCR